VSYRTLVWAPIAVALLFVFAELPMPGSSQVIAIRGEVEFAKLLWLAGALATARAFEAGDYLRRAWMILALAVVFFLMRDVTQIPFIHELAPATPVAIFSGVMVILGNAAQTAGIWMLARVWNAVGLDDAVRGTKRPLFIVVIGASVLLTGPSIAHDAASALSGNLEAIPHLGSDLGDAVNFVLLAALVRTALALRGGVVFWTWSLLAASQLAWILFDGARTLVELFGASWFSSPLVECLRVVGVIYFCAAGVAQRWIVSARFPVGVGGPAEVADGAAKAP
jgi:hypothetical protein